MLTGDLAPTTGTCTLAGKSLVQERAACFEVMGYCPQFDALFDLLTGEECLAFYARVKGLPENEIQPMVDDAIARMDLQRYRNELTQTYSGGNKRKLSLCVAYIGSPRVVFLGMWSRVRLG